MRQAKAFILYWLPPFVWMVTIFFFSSRPHFGITNSFFMDFIVFKLLHVIEYGFLYYLLFRGFHKTTSFKREDQLVVAIMIAFFYAISDEIHQRFVPTREGKIRDIAIDMIGVSVAYYVIKSNFKTVTEKFL